MTGAAAWYLDIDGIDTVAEVTLNGTLVLQAGNAFRRYRPDVTAALRQGRNTISILIRSATRVAAELAEAPALPDPLCRAELARSPTATCCASRPAISAGTGTWRSRRSASTARLRCRPMRQARIEHVQTAQQHHDDGSVSVEWR